MNCSIEIFRIKILNLSQARKNNAEQKGMGAAHVRDGVAMAKFLCWSASERTGNTI
jgi:hypothetical protein